MKDQNWWQQSKKKFAKNNQKRCVSWAAVLDWPIDVLVFFEI